MGGVRRDLALTATLMSLNSVWARVYILENGCWEWRGKRRYGYGRIQRSGRSEAAHRVIYEALFGPIPEGLVLDHLCRNRPCCNPLHLEPVTARENSIRGEHPKYVAFRNGTCEKGLHDMAEHGRARPSGPRYCVPCLAEAGRKRRLKMSQARGT